jgi:hypothetical protein
MDHPVDDVSRSIRLPNAPTTRALGARRGHMPDHVQYNLAIRILGGGARVFLQHAYSYTVFAKTGKLKAGTHILGVSRGGFGGESSRNPPYTVNLYGKTLIRSKNLAG